MTTTDPEEVHRLRQRLEKSEATRAKLRASLIALKVCLPEVSPPPRSRPLALARGPRVPTSRRHAFFFARAIRAIPRHPLTAPSPSFRPKPATTRPPSSFHIKHVRAGERRARAPALEAAETLRRAGGDVRRVADGDGVAASAVSKVAALLSEARRRARTPLRGTRRRRAAPRSRVARGGERRAPPAHRRDGGSGGGPRRRRRPQPPRAGGRARRRAAGARRSRRPRRRGVRSGSGPAGREGRALADARRASRRADTAATNLAARVADLERQRVHGSRRSVASTPRRPPAAAPERDLDVAAGEHAERV